MIFTPTSIPDVILVEPKIYGDQRGFFMETYNTQKFIDRGIKAEFVQDNHSGSQRGTLRGLHYQIRHAQGKLVRVVVGEIFDVAVDIRRESPTFGQWVGKKLSTENRWQMWVPPGFAHGFYVLSDWAEVVYKVTDIYAPEWDRTILWNDPDINIDWPLLDGEEPILSEKDRRGKLFREAEIFN
jgi:dTDP-4-dehydrorhamnose 3,5-epimerase